MNVCGVQRALRLHLGLVMYGHDLSKIGVFAAPSFGALSCSVGFCAVATVDDFAR